MSKKKTVNNSAIQKLDFGSPEFTKQIEKIGRKIGEAELKKDTTKRDLVNKYVPPPWGVEYFLVYRLPDEKITEVMDEYRKGGGYRVYDLYKSLIVAGGDNVETIDDIHRRKIFSLSDLEWLEHHLNNYWRKEHERLLSVFIEQAQKQGFISKSQSEKLKKFDRTKYDRAIFQAALERYDNASRIDKNYERCLLEELRSRQMAPAKFEETMEFYKWNTAFRQYRSNEAKKILSKPN